MSVANIRFFIRFSKYFQTKTTHFLKKRQPGCRHPRLRTVGAGTDSPEETAFPGAKRQSIFSTA
ncbi:MAG TPA: hypothetical protein DCX97_04110, partial [Alistipes sp.]|nr:hypothetical protein [Alistipes sp.]